MDYPSEVVERIRGTKDALTLKDRGRQQAERWISEHATYRQIEYIAERNNLPSDVCDVIYRDVPHLVCGEFWKGFSDEVKRFWGILQDIS